MPPKYGHNNETAFQQAWNVKESVLKPQGDTRKRVDLFVRDFETLLEQKGIDVLVYRTTFCPKVKSVDGAEHEIDCTLCNGSGFLDVFPLKTRAFIQNQDLEKQPKEEGLVDGNHVAMTFKLGVELQYFTLVELCDFTEIYYQRVLRNPDSLTDILKYSACRVNLVVDYDGTMYYQDTHFSINTNGDIQWGATRPADNVPYTIHYESKVQFRCMKAMHVNRFTQVKVDGGLVEHIKLPEQWLLAKEFLVRREDQSGNELIQGPYDNHSIIP